MYASELKRFIPLDEKGIETEELIVEMKWSDSKLIKEEKDFWEKKERDTFKPEHPEFKKKIEQSSKDGLSAFYELGC